MTKYKNAQGTLKTQQQIEHISGISLKQDVIIFKRGEGMSWKVLENNRKIKFLSWCAENDSPSAVKCVVQTGY